MPQDEIIRMAREAGLSYSQTLDELKTPFCDGVHIEELERFAALVAAAEREECAKVCVEKAVEYASCPDEAWFYKVAAAAIRARGEK